jgi:tetratricopeptide (TPR) repeat protein
VNLGETLYFREEYADSIEAFEWAVKFEPDWTEARRGLIRSLMAVGRYDAAAANLAYILQRAPVDAEAWLTLGDEAMSRGDELMARENWQKAAAADPAAKAVVERAQARLAGLRRTAVAGTSRK